jgi:prepilin-type N-terminal cleavage/methylation domain-containing protein
MVRPSRSEEGFTVIELMIVVLIISVMAMLIGPGISEFISDTRAASAAEELVRLQRHIRARVEQTGLAHMMVFSAAGSNNLGTVTVWEGMNNHCSTTPWTQALTNGSANNHFPVEQVNMADYNPTSAGNAAANDSNRFVIQLTAQTGVTTGNAGTVVSAFNLCFQPNGLTLLGTSATPWGFAQYVNPVTFFVRRTYNGTQHGVTRWVLYPPGGSARLRI